MKLMLISFIFFISVFSYSEDDPRNAPNKQPTNNTDSKQNAAVIDFEGDIIEGERKRPYIFIQTGGDASSLDSMLFFRNDFNDFHESDKKRRPSFIPSKKQRK